MNRAPRRIDRIVTGCYRYRRVKGGPWMPALVSVEEDMIYIVEAGDKLRVGIPVASYEDAIVNNVVEGTAFDSDLWRVLFFGEPISDREYDHLLGLIAWAKEHQPDHPLNHPERPIKLSAIPVTAVF